MDKTSPQIEQESGTPLIEAMRIAKDQRTKHEMQVSGAWSISGEKFCKKYNLDYDRACCAQEDDNHEVLLQIQNENYSKYCNLVGEPPDEATLEKIEQKASDEFYEETEAWAFWDNVTKQILEKKLTSQGK